MAHLLRVSVIYLVGLLLGLLSNIVSSFLLPSFEQQRWLAVALFLGASALGLALALGQEERRVRRLAGRAPNQQLRQAVEEMLAPFLGTASERQAMVVSALGDEFAQQLDFSGSADEFTPRLVSVCLRYGELAPGKHTLVAL